MFIKEFVEKYEHGIAIDISEYLQPYSTLPDEETESTLYSATENWPEELRKQVVSKYPYKMLTPAYALQSIQLRAKYADVCKGKKSITLITGDIIQKLVQQKPDATAIYLYVGEVDNHYAARAMENCSREIWHTVSVTLTYLLDTIFYEANFFDTEAKCRGYLLLLDTTARDAFVDSAKDWVTPDTPMAASMVFDMATFAHDIGISPNELTERKPFHAPRKTPMTPKKFCRRLFKIYGYVLDPKTLPADCKLGDPYVITNGYQLGEFSSIGVAYDNIGKVVDFALEHANAGGVNYSPVSRISSEK